MSTHISLTNSLRTICAGLVLCSTLPAAGANVGACRQPTPCPCAADGVCRPNSETWGYYYPQWRPWPGDSIVQPGDTAPTLDGESDTLAPYLTPTPRNEDLRGPAKSKKKTNKSSEAEPASGNIQPADELPDLPASDLFDELPGFDPQGSRFRSSNESPAVDLQLPVAEDVAMLPSRPMAMEPLRNMPHLQESSTLDPLVELGNQESTTDAGSKTSPADNDPPPMLPQKLRLSSPSTANALFGVTILASQPITAVVATPATTPTAKRLTSTARVNSPIVPASLSPSDGIHLVNPAAATIAQPLNESLQQAIYYEATDQRTNDE